MSAFVDRLRAMIGRLFGRSSHARADSQDGSPPGGSIWSGETQRRVTPGRVALAGVLIVCVAGLAVALGRGHSVGSFLASHSEGASASAGPLTPTALVVSPGHVVADGTKPLTVTLSAPPAGKSPVPTLRPAVAGTWSAIGDSEVFTPASTLMPCTTYTLTIWANTTAAGHSRIGRRHTSHLHVACPSISALQQALARLHYMGATFHPLYDVHTASGPEPRREAAEHAFHPFHGVLSPDPRDAPPIETGHLDETTRGALTVFQSDHNIEPTGEPEYATWRSLLAAETDYRLNPRPYTWVTVSESIPETLEVHVGHHVALSTPANTGVPGAETPQGVFPIFSRFVSTTMSGTDVDGTKYVVPEVPWVNYFNGGDAVHGYPRASYGSPQSNGCVELPIETAHTVFGMLALGDIVEVTG
jgi:peptidoglycan hydrolase-like protein with peptidoglycan-binding domain